MAKIPTHYGNLKVARNAPPEVIRAAYTTLSEKFQPDRKPGNAESARILAILDAAYDALSDSEKRKAHDRWIAEQELLAAQAERGTNPPRRLSTGISSSAVSLYRKLGPKSHILRSWFWYGIAGCVIWITFSDRSSSPPSGLTPYQATLPTPSPEPAYVRPDTAPNGQTWPATADYVKGYQSLNKGGLSSVTVDNSRNDSDVFVKLESLDRLPAYPVRIFYIPASQSFTLKKVKTGRYDVRYRNLRDGGLWRSESFTLEEIPMHNGTQFSNFTMTLYKVPFGNMKTYTLSEADF